MSCEVWPQCCNVTEEFHRPVGELKFHLRRRQSRNDSGWFWECVFFCQPSALWKENALLLWLLQLCHSLPCLCISICTCVCACVCAYTCAFVFQHSSMMFNLLSQKAFDPFYTLIRSILMPKWRHLEQKSALSPTSATKSTTASCPLLLESHH